MAPHYRGWRFSSSEFNAWIHELVQDGRTIAEARFRAESAALAASADPVVLDYLDALRVVDRDGDHWVITDPEWLDPAGSWDAGWDGYAVLVARFIEPVLAWDGPIPVIARRALEALGWTDTNLTLLFAGRPLASLLDATAQAVIPCPITDLSNGGWLPASDIEQLCFEPVVDAFHTQL